MLKSMRSGVFSGLFLVLLVMGAAGLILTDAGGFFGSGIKTSDVAKVGSHTINSRPFDNKLRRILSMQGVDPQAAYDMGLVHQALFREIRDLLMLQGANDLGIAISNEEITDYINEIIEPYMDEDTTSKKSEILASLLRQNGMTETIFIEDAQREMTNAIVNNAIKSAAVYTPKLLAKDLNAFSEETRNIEYIVFNNNKMKIDQDADDETLMRYYNTFKERYRIPEKRSFTLARLDKDKIKGDISITDEQVRAIYDENKDSYTVPLKHKIAQAVADTEGDALKIKSAAEEGTPLSTAATNVTGDDASFIDTQEYLEGSLPEVLNKDAFAEGVTKGDIIGPIETALGWHVLKIVDVIPAHAQDFKDVKDSIAQELLDEEIWEILDNTLSEIEDRLFGGEDPQQVITDYKMTSESFKDLTRQGVLEGTQDSPLKDLNSEDAITVLKTANDLLSGETSRVFELNDSSLAFIVMDEIKDSVIKPFEDVKKQVRKEWTKEQKDNAAFMKAKELSDKIADSTITWKDAVKETGLKNHKSSISRSASFKDEELEKDISAQGRNLLLSADIHDAQVIPGAEKTVLAYIKDTSLSNDAKPSEDQDEVVSIAAMAETQNFQQEALGLLYLSLQEKYKYTVNENLLTFLYNKPQQQ
ncbi:MAG: hypothetical protein CL561_11775 [Alphaproteobacteria bacterium]|nr:hypothetical protein [Alphaproteobacteria bacterium]|tara:strand:- start:906 stop:2840 length:1935 start_codon:yes stop_codon:yes gene_type:complete